MKRFVLLVLVICLLVGISAHAENLALPINIELSERIRKLPEKVGNFYVDEFKKTLSLLSESPPKGNHLFGWKGNRAPLANKRVNFYLTTSEDPIVKKMRNLPGGGMHKDADGFTLLMGKKGGEQLITTFIVIDKIYFNDQKMKVRDDAQVRLTTMLAHEIFGNVQAMLEEDFSKRPPMNFAQRKQMEVRAFRAGVSYLERFMESPRWRTLSPEIKAQVILAQRRERRLLNEWLVAVAPAARNQEPPARRPVVSPLRFPSHAPGENPFYSRQYELYRQQMNRRR